MNFTFSKWDAIVLFLSALIVTNVWSGYFWTISPLTILVSAGIVYFFIRKKMIPSHPAKDATTPTPAFNPNPLVVCGLVIVLATIFFLVQGGYDLSADAAPSFAAELIHGTIPSSYAPYFDLPFFYPPGLPSVVSPLLGLGLHSYTWMWVFAVLGMVLLMIYSSRLASVLAIPYSTWLVPVLIVGLRFPIQSLLSGEYPLVLGYGLALAAVWFGRKNEGLFVLVAGATTLLHPYAGVITFILGWVIHSWNVKTVLTTGMGVAALALPMLLFEFGAFQSTASATLQFIPFSLTGIIPFIFLIGIIPMLLLAILVAVAMVKKHDVLKLIREEPRPWILFGVGFVSVILFAYFPFLVFGGKIILLAGLGAVWASTILLKKILPFSQRGFEWKLAVILLVAIIAFNVTSGTFIYLSKGTKSTLEEATFATWFSSHFPAQEKTVLFLSKGHAKMAQYAGTIPVDALSAHFLTSVTYNVFSNEETKRIQAQSAAFKQMMKDQCVECVNDFQADYIVVNTRDFPTLPLTPLAEENGFLVYAGTI